MRNFEKVALFIKKRSVFGKSKHSTRRILRMPYNRDLRHPPPFFSAVMLNSTFSRNFHFFNNFFISFKLFNMFENGIGIFGKWERKDKKFIAQFSAIFSCLFTSQSMQLYLYERHTQKTHFLHKALKKWSHMYYPLSNFWMRHR